uniref:Uncharacterized protein n=1 Tax=Avena sativa TaxID=4498 RepID=A0ACD5X2C0_AVESA
MVVNCNRRMRKRLSLSLKISQIRDLIPEYGKGFLAVCLEAYNQNPEEVIQRIFDGTLHPDLLALDTSLQEMPQQKTATNVGKDKGKGILVESVPNIKNKPHNLEAQSSSVSSASKAPTSSVALVSSSSKAPTSSVSSVPQGRFTRKSNDDLPDSVILDSQKAKDAVKSAVLQSQYEYDDEYDDSFDDLGFSVVESSYEENEGANDVEGSSSGPRWASQKKPQFYVKDGKNYSYKVTGSVAVSNAREAAVLNQTQKDTIHGLGRGGNIPMGGPNRQQHRVMEEEEGGHADRGGSAPHGQGRRGGWDQSNPSEDNRNAGAPRGGRGGRRGGRNHSNLPEVNDGQQGFGRGARRDNRPEANNHSDGQQGFGRGARRGGRDEDNRPEVNNHPNGQQGFGRGARRGGDRNHDDPLEENEDRNPAQGFARGGPGPRGGGGRRGGRNHNRRDQALRKHMQGMAGL